MITKVEERAKKHEVAKELLKEGYTIKQVMKATGLGKNTVYAVRNGQGYQNLKKPGDKRIPDSVWNQWDYMCNRVGIPQRLWEIWDNLNSQYGKGALNCGK